MFQWIGKVEYILRYGGQAEHWGSIPATRLASRKILIEQNIKKRKGPALCVLCGFTKPFWRLYTDLQEALQYPSVAFQQPIKTSAKRQRESVVKNNF
jgi:hypothetical protein